MKKGDYIKALLRSPRTVFTSHDIALLWGDTGSNTTRVRLNYYIANGNLIRVRRGIYVKDNNYDRLELASRIMTPSYVGFETVLAREGVVFQFYGQIFAASYQTREILCDKQIYEYRKIKDIVLTNPAGLNQESPIATLERALLDIIYLNPQYHFDNLSPINWDKIQALVPIYRNNKMTARVNKIYKQFKSEN